MAKKLQPTLEALKANPKATKHDDKKTHTHKRGNKNNTENDIHKVVIIT